VTQKCNGANKSYRATRRSLQPKILKKNHRNTKSNNQNENFPKKLCFVPLDCTGTKNSKATRRNLQAQPKMLKRIVGTSNQPIRTKKVCLVP
jgi:hypothetical protein